MVKNYNCFSVESLYTFSIGFTAVFSYREER